MTYVSQFQKDFTSRALNLKEGVWLLQSIINQPALTFFEHDCLSFFTDFVIIYVEFSNTNKHYGRENIQH